MDLLEARGEAMEPCLMINAWGGGTHGEGLRVVASASKHSASIGVDWVRRLPRVRRFERGSKPRGFAHWSLLRGR